MVGLPIAVITAVTTLLATFEVSPEESVTVTMGAADALLRPSPGPRTPVRQDYSGQGYTLGSSTTPDRRPWSAQEIGGLLPPGSRVIPWATSAEVYRSGHWLSSASLTELDLRDPMTRGLYLLERGRFPSAAGEVLVSPDFVRRGAGIGSTLTLTEGARAFRVVGIVATPRVSRRQGIEFAIGLPGGGLVPSPSRTEWLVSTPDPVGWRDVTRLNSLGFVVASRAVISHPPPEALDYVPPGQDDRPPLRLLTYGMTVTMIVLEVVLLAGPAFAVGIRRRRRELALIAAQGASERQLRRVVLADSLLLGPLAAVLGVLGGLVLAWGAVPVLQQLREGTVAGPYEVPVGTVAGVAALGLASAVLAAVVPARQAARTDVVATLAGRRGEAGGRRGWPAAGVVSVALGVVLTVFSNGRAIFFVLGDRRNIDNNLVSAGQVGGLLLTMVGMVALTPSLVGVAGRLAARLPLPFRLAARDATRNRGRTAPAVGGGPGGPPGRAARRHGGARAG
ncbi:FtsX-like permease family protein, partial [Sphaerisporangium sp. NPDC049002]|uniref:FtsX-like permease family protein n=1 Tax=Sphaerisporangium sp. NPDC049002 TaxID=3155392 RepID=UPI0033E109F4